MLRSYSYGTFCGHNELPDEILNLFTDLVENPEKKIEFASEIISNGLQGRINFNSDFNIDAYEATIRKNNRLTKESKKKKEVFLDMNDSSDDFDEVASKGGIKVNRFMPASLQLQDAFEQVLLDDELQYAISTIKELDDMLQVEENVFILKVIRQAIRGIPDSVKILRRICDEYEVVAEQIKVILSSGKSFDELFGTV